MARRLLEAGVSYVEVGMRDDLIASGLWSETVLVWLGDFGRTPRINARGGRDHFPRVSSVVLGGGPIRAGQVIGASDRDGEEIAERPVTVPDSFASLAQVLGIDGGEVHVTGGARPVTTVDEVAVPIAELV